MIILYGGISRRYIRGDIMPNVYLSPSNQMHNRCAYGDLEGQHCASLADLISKKLLLHGIDSKIRIPSHSLSTNIAEAKSFGADLYIPIHTNAANSSVRGTRFGYASGREDSLSACQVFVDVWKKFYPLPDKVKLATYNTFSEAKKPHCPSVYTELIFHSNDDDADFLHRYMSECADALVDCICAYFDFKGSGSLSDSTIRYGSKGDSVIKLQNFLVSSGYDIVVDGKFGRQTETILKAYQTKNGLEADGVCGPITWGVINGSQIDKELYTVSIRNLTKIAADFLTATYSDAIMTKQ